jgi:hypothetical protein
VTGCQSEQPDSGTPPPPTLTPAPPGRNIIVTNADNSGPGSLRQALQDARDSDTITFDPAVFPPDAPVTIFVSSEELPHIRVNNLTIDASNAGVILDGSRLEGDWVAGLQIVEADGNTIRGLQVVNFTGTGIVVAGRSQNNTIGGDRNIGSGPIGQGNLASNNDFGIGIWNFASNNFVIGNLVGTDVSGTGDLGNKRSGVWVTEGGVGNVIGPDNIIAYNDGVGIVVEFPESSGNTLTQNSIHDNSGGGIRLLGGGNASLDAPFILDFDLISGFVTGTACANCSVEIFSDDVDEGAFYEGQALADSSGVFTFNKGAVIVNDNITATTTDTDGNTSGFSWPAGLSANVKVLQEGNTLPGFRLLAKPSSQLPPDTRLGWGLYSSNIFNDIPHLDFLINDYTNLGVKRIDTSMQEIEEPIDWNRDEFEIHPNYDQFIDDLNEIGIAVNYKLHYWDKAGHAAREELEAPRFQTDESIDDFIEYVRFVVGHFKGRIQYYTLWSEPDVCGGSKYKCIRTADYIELARQVIPVIREEDPQAKVGLAPYVLYFARDQVFTILSSEVISMFDVIQWHGIYSVTPNNDFYGNYYYEYPLILEEMKQTASANGFDGEYWGTELTWCSEEFPTCHSPDQPYGLLETDKIAAKYDARGFVIHLGMDIGVGWGGLESNAAPWSYPTVRNLNTVMNGARPISHEVKIENEPPNTATYAFTTPDGEMLFALWTNGEAVDDDPGINATLTFPDMSAEKVVGIDVLYGFEQELVFEMVDGDLVVSNLMVKDYPLILRLIP